MEKCIALVLIVCLPLGAPAIGQEILIDHTNFDSIDGLDQGTIDQIGQLRIFFSHASVGANMMSGMQALHSSNAARYPLTIVSDNGVPPAVTSPGTMYHYSRGNPGWSAKITSFATYVANGWCAPKVDITFDKLCYIDQDANANAYTASMVSLETAHPNTTFVYITMPITTSTGGSGAQRQMYNQAVRQFCAANDKVLFDLGDIEAWSPAGAEQLFVYNTTICQKMYSPYTDDGGHLNALGAQRVAKGLYSLYGEIVPEPATIALFASGGVVLFCRRRSRLTTM